MNGTTTTAVPDPVEEYVSVLIPAIIVPVIFFIVLFLFCVWLKLSKNKAGPRKPSTYEDFSHVDNTEMLRMSTDLTLEENKALWRDRCIVWSCTRSFGLELEAKQPQTNQNLLIGL